jgi:hypothetical protein
LRDTAQGAQDRGRPSPIFPQPEVHVNIRDLAARLDELIDVCKPAGPVSTKCPAPSADVTSKAMAMKGSVARLRTALDEAGPPPALTARQPLYLRQNDPVIQAVARLIGHHGVPEVELLSLHKSLVAIHGLNPVNDVVKELSWTAQDTRWVKLRPETLRSLRPFIGPLPDAEDCECWWADRGGIPPVRTPETEKARREQAAKPLPKEGARPGKKPAKESLPQKPTRDKTA